MLARISERVRYVHVIDGWFTISFNSSGPVTCNAPDENMVLSSC